MSDSRTPLLDRDEDDEDVSKVEGTKPVTCQQILQEATLVCKILIPVMSAQVVQFGVTLIGVAFVGRLGKLALAGISLAVSIANVTGISIMIGLTSGLDTLCSQAFGARKYHLLGEHLQRALLVNSFPALLISFMWWFMKPVLKLLGQDEEISLVATQYLRVFIPGLWFCLFWASIRRYFVNQNVTVPQLIAAIVGLLVCPGLNYLYILKLELGVEGAALAVETIYIIMILVAFVFYKYMYKNRTIKTWTGFTPKAFRGWLGFVKLSVPACLMIILEWWTYEAATLMAGVLENPEITVSAFSLNQQLNALWFMMPLSLGFATATRVGNQIGEGNPSGARLSLAIALAIELSLWCIVASILLFSPVKRYWSALFTKNDPEVNDLSASTMPFVVFGMFGDGLKEVLSGAIRGTGQQILGSIISGISYALIGLPIAAALAFEWKQSLAPGLKGLFIGLSIGAISHAILNSLLIFFTDWDKISKAAIAKFEADNDTFFEKLEKQLSGGMEPVLTRIQTFERIEENLTRSGSSIPVELILSQSGNIGSMALAASPAARVGMVSDQWRTLAAENQVDRQEAAHRGVSYDQLNDGRI